MCRRCVMSPVVFSQFGAKVYYLCFSGAIAEQKLFRINTVFLSSINRYAPASNSTERLFSFLIFVFLKHVSDSF